MSHHHLRGFGLSKFLLSKMRWFGDLIWFDWGDWFVDWGEWGDWGDWGEWGECGDWGEWGVTQLVKDYFVQKALDSNLNNSINEFYEFRNFMNTWSQEDNNYTNLLLTGYECKPVKSIFIIIFLYQVYAILGVVSQYQLYSSSANSSAAIPGPKLNNDDFYDIEQVTSKFSFLWSLAGFLWHYLSIRRFFIMMLHKTMAFYRTFDIIA